MYLQWKLDDLDAIEAENPLGSFSILGSSGRIEEREVFLDAAFEALAYGLERLATKNRITVDLIDEPWPVTLERDRGGVLIRYRNQVAWVDDLEVLRADIYIAVDRLVSQLDSARASKGEPRLELSALRDYLRQMKASKRGAER